MNYQWYPLTLPQMCDKQLRMTINIPVYSNIQKIAQDDFLQCVLFTLRN
jgi:hypothetical protein